MRFWLTLIAPATLLGCAATPPAPEEVGAETFIPYAGSDGIVEWRAAGDGALYVRALTGGWYLIRTMNPCGHLRTAVSLGFITAGLDQLDRHGAILAEGQRCPIVSVTRARRAAGGSE